MPQALSKCRRPSHVLTSTPPARHGLQDKARMWRSRKRFNGKRKPDKVNFIPVPAETVQAPREEDWEQEIEEFSRRMNEEKEKEMSDKTPYDTVEELKVALCEMSLYHVPHAPSPHPQLYVPSTHHTPPVKWIRRISRFETDQFADAEE